MRLFIVLLLFPLAASSQVNTTTWGVDDTSICIVKSTDFFQVHDYIAMENFSGSPLSMVWVRHTALDWPVQWEAGFTDPDSFYTDVLVVDTGFFTLPYPVEFSNQLIIDVDHNNHVDTSYLKFKVYPAAYPEDSLWLTYCIIIHLPDVGFSENESTDFNIEFNAGENLLRIFSSVETAYQIEVVNLAGEIILSQSLHEKSEAISLTQLPTGIYIVRLQSAECSFSQKIVIH